MIETRELESLLACPICHGPLQKNDLEFKCENCRKVFQRNQNIPVFINSFIYENEKIFESAQHRLTFWDQGWEKRLHGDHNELLNMSPQQLKERLRGLVENYYKDDVPRFIEAGPDKVKNKVVLDIGCGAGFSSSLFTYYGANYIGLDISHTAATMSLNNIHKMNGQGITIQGDAESLPFHSNSVEFVYSDGVLHHTPHIEKAFQEVYRVLIPGGTAVIALYATYSLAFLQKRIEGFFHGYFSKTAQARWMSHETENDWRTNERKNEWTTTISKSEIERLLATMSWGSAKIRRCRFHWNHVRVIGYLLKAFNLEKSVRFSERLLSPLIGSMWVMTLIKPIDSDNPH